MNPVRAVIFDMDGTLVNSMPFHMQSWELFFAKHRISLTPEAFDSMHHGTVYDIMPRIFGNHLTAEESLALGNEKEALFRELYKGNVVPMPGLMDWLASFRQAGLRLAVATAADDANAFFTLEALGIPSWFDAVVTSNRIKKGKPDPAVYLAAAAAIGVSPAECLVFEDTVSGVKAGVAAGMRVVGITSGTTSEVLLQAGALNAIPDFTAFHWRIVEQPFKPKVSEP